MRIESTVSAQGHNTGITGGIPGINNKVPTPAKETLAEKLMAALQSQEDGDTTAIDDRYLPGPKARAKFAELDKKYDGVEAEEFSFGGQTWYAITAAVDQASDPGYWFFSKNDQSAGYAEDDR